MMTVQTTAKTLREYNAKNKGSELEAVFIGYIEGADGYKVRAYIDYIKGTHTTVGDFYHIFFGCPYASDED